jgi:hypothetical protein
MAFKKKMTLFLFLSLHSFSLKASISKIDCGQNMYRSSFVNQIYFVSNREGYDCSFIEDALKTVDQVALLVDNPPVVNFIIQDRAFDATFDKGFIIQFPQRYHLKNSHANFHANRKDQTLPVVAHEYGHALFSKILEANIPMIKTFNQKAKELSRLKLQSKDLLSQAHRFDNTFTVAQRINIQKSIQSVGLQIGKKKNSFYKMKKNHFLLDMVTPYHELFADIVAVFHFGRLDIIADTLRHPHPNLSELNKNNARAFSSRFVDIENLDASLPHSRFFSVRQYIGRYFRPFGFKEKKLYLKLISQILVSEVQRNIDLKRRNIDQEPGLEQNRRIIVKLQKILPRLLSWR